MRNVLITFFGSDTDVMTDQVKEIMSNPYDKKNYLEALSRLKELKKRGEQGREKMILSNNAEFELTT